MNMLWLSKNKKDKPEEFEHFEVANMIEERMKNYNPEDNIFWEELKKECGL